MADVFSSFSPAPSLRALRGGGSIESSILPQRCQLLSFSLHRLTSATTGRKKKAADRPVLSCSCAAHGTPTSTRVQRRQPHRRSSSPMIPVVSEGRDEDGDLMVCPGCGIVMQDADPNLPGFYQKPLGRKAEFSRDVDEDSGSLGEDDFLELSEEEEEEEEEKEKVEIEGSFSLSDLDEDSQSDGDVEDDILFASRVDEDDDVPSDWDIEEPEEEDETVKKELDGFGPAGVGYGNITEENVRKQREKLSKSERKRRAREEAKRALENAITVCARCHSLRNYGQVKNEKAENLIPISTSTGSSPPVVMVVDCVDFDGSFPKRAAKSLFKALEGNKTKLVRLPKLVLVATKVDLLPSQISPTRLDRWVRNRAKANGAPKLNGVFLVSARKDLGVRNLLSFIKELSGPRGNVWVIGAQNAGKSTLINAFAKREGVGITRLTEAAVPGTTLGILRIGGILPAKAKMYDTPGLLHSNLMTMRLDREEQKMVEIRKELQPRTYRIKAGQTVHVGGLLRLDLAQSSVSTIYVTVWASPSVSLHLGKTENAEEMWNSHVGVRLQDRASELGQWNPREIKVSGISWEVKSVDIAVAGLGWLSIGLKGEATLLLWTYDGVYVTQREPLVIDRAPFIERPGFLLPKAISDALARKSKIETDAMKEKDDES
ncbi:unnamed protein product [Spirodela intermedia]|uniref:G domain-containing protein n=1 Tax=Spirodela intermedia TaxID=51605 RepID=A0A7I8JSG1_SPIIN|nr:unnamed protein product [Spirodela intermedia]CAA6673118.1 unnamed protein product [Spirodela intermedia]